MLKLYDHTNKIQALTLNICNLFMYNLHLNNMSALNNLLQIKTCFNKLAFDSIK